jgi:hypothetical protein
VVAVDDRDDGQHAGRDLAHGAAAALDGHDLRVLNAS